MGFGLFVSKRYSLDIPKSVFVVGHSPRVNFSQDDCCCCDKHQEMRNKIVEGIEEARLRKRG